MIILKGSDEIVGSLSVINYKWTERNIYPEKNDDGIAQVLWLLLMSNQRNELTMFRVHKYVVGRKLSGE